MKRPEQHPDVQVAPGRTFITRNYRIFQANPLNRPTDARPNERLRLNLEKWGAIWHWPILVFPIKDPEAEYKILDGGHRAYYCEALKLPIFFQVSDRDMDPAEIAEWTKQWTTPEHVGKYVKLGNPNYAKLDALCEEYGTGHTATSTLLVEQGVTLSKAQMNSGEFEMAPDGEEHFRNVMMVVQAAARIDHRAKNAKLMKSVGNLFRACPEVRPELLCQKLSTNPAKFKIQPDQPTTLENLEQVCNYRSKSKLLSFALPVAQLLRDSRVKLLVAVRLKLKKERGTKPNE